MAIRSRDFVSIAEGIRSQELSAKQVIEVLSSRSVELVSMEGILGNKISYLEAAIAAAYEDTDEDGEPDYSRISALEAQLNEAESELGEVEAERVKTDNELETKQRELEAVQEEKAETLFEIQERARKTSHNIGIAGGMIGAYATVGSRLQSSLQSSLSSLSQAAGILGGSVDSGTNGISNGSSSGIGGSKAGAGRNAAAGALSAFVGGGDGGTLSLPSQFSTHQDQLSTPAAVLGFHAEQQTIAVQPLQVFSTEQGTNIYAASAFSDLGTDVIQAASGASFQSNEVTQGLQDSFQADGSPFRDTFADAVGTATGTQMQRQHTFEDWIDPANYKDGHYVGEGQPWGYKPFGGDTSTEGTAMTPAQQKLNAYMQSHNYGKGDFASFTKDPEWQSLYSAAYPSSDLLASLQGSSLAKRHLNDYMHSHGYDAGDFSTYSKDPEWQRLHQMAYPDSGVIGSLVGSQLALEQLHKYMLEHQYTEADLHIYSKDLTWQRLHRAAYPLSAPKNKVFSESTDHERIKREVKHCALRYYRDAKKTTPYAVHTSEVNHRPTNQILFGSADNSLMEAFKPFKNMPIQKLGRDNLQTITKLAVDNLSNLYGGVAPESRFKLITKKVKFTHEGFNGNAGCYDPKDDSIHINLDENITVGDLLASIDHEAMHLLAAEKRNAFHMFFGGRATGVRNSEATFGNVGMNEGLTEMYSIKNMKSINPDYESRAYVDLVRLMVRFETACGEDVLLNAYMTNDLSEIKRDYNVCMGNPKAFDKLCCDLDLLHHMWDPRDRDEIYGRIEKNLEKYQKVKTGGSVAPRAEKRAAHQVEPAENKQHRASTRFASSAKRVSPESSDPEAIKWRDRHERFVEGVKVPQFTSKLQGEVAQQFLKKKKTDTEDEGRGQNERTR